MKKLLISVILAIIVFAAVYVAQCYMVPGWRIKLAAPAMEYFAASLRHMVLLKGMIAAQQREIEALRARLAMAERRGEAGEPGKAPAHR